VYVTHNIYLQVYVCYYVAHKTFGSNVTVKADRFYMYIFNKNRSNVSFKGKTLFTCMRFMHYYRSTHVSFFCLEILENGPSGSKHVAD